VTAPLPPAAWFERLELAPWLLLAPLAYLVLRALEHRRARARLAFLGPRVLRAWPGPSPRRLTLARSLFALGVVSGGLALLHPSLGERAPVPAWRGVDLVLALDVSRSMRARDLAPDRLARAQAEVRALAHAAQGDRLGLVLFAGEARVRVPLTRDLAAVAALASAATPDDVARGGTDLAAALEAAGGLIARGAEAQGAVLLLTDGEDHGGRGRAAAAHLLERGIAVHVLGLGSERGARIPHQATEGSPETYLKDRAGVEVLSRLDARGLAALAAAGGGSLVLAQGAAPVAPDLRRGALLARARAQADDAGRELPANRYQAFLALALLCFAADLALRAPPGLRRLARRRAVPSAAVHRAPALPHAARASACLLLVLTTACGARDEAHDHAAAGRHREALAAYEARLLREGGQSAPETHVNVALCALRLGDLERAARAAREAEARGGAGFAPWGAFVRGHVAFARSLEAESASQRPDGDRVLLERALTLAEDALAAWRLAASTPRAGGGADWPEARRNVERALLRLEALREKQRTGAGARRTPVVIQPPPGAGEPASQPPPPQPPAPTPEPRPGAAADGDPSARVVTTDLAPSDLVRLPDLLRAKAQQRAQRRGVERARASRDVEKDW
jgi:Ca-activated chloride channel family protein